MEAIFQTGSFSKLRGQIERITFVNEENGFTIAKMKVQGERELVTVVGNFPGINPGEVLELLGAWTNHPKFGSQFKAERFKSVMPASATGFNQYRPRVLESFVKILLIEQDEVFPRFSFLKFWSDNLSYRGKSPFLLCPVIP